jgi:hypothetical protein
MEQAFVDKKLAAHCHDKLEAFEKKPFPGTQLGRIDLPQTVAEKIPAVLETVFHRHLALHLIRNISLRRARKSPLPEWAFP